MTTRHKIGWIGTGAMGSAMCGHLLAAGHELTVHNRTRASAEPLLARGAAWAQTPAQVAARSEVVFAIVGHPTDVRQVILGEDGVLAGGQPGLLAVDMTTSEPALAVEIEAAASARGHESLDAPVSGGPTGALSASLSIMVGGGEEAFERARPLLELMGTTVVRQGGPGAGQHTKMANQILIATGMVGVCEALLYAHRTGLDPVAVLRSVSGGAAGSWSLTNYGPRILAGDLDPGFLVEHFVKDMGIALAEARSLGLALPGLALAHALYVALLGKGRGRLGVQALVLALSELSGETWPA